MFGVHVLDPKELDESSGIEKDAKTEEVQHDEDAREKADVEKSEKKGT